MTRNDARAPRSAAGSRLRRRDHPHRFPDPLPRGLRQAAGLSRQRRLGAEAALRARRDRHAYKMEYANVHRGLHYLSNAATAALRGRARDRAPLPQCAERRGDHLHAQRHRGASTSSPARSAAWTIGKGDEIVLSIMEHHSNIVPWHFHRERKGAVLKWAPIADDGEFLLDEFEKLLDQAHQDGRHHPHVERARHRRADQGGRPASRTRAASRCWSTAARPPCTCRSTCRISTATSTSSPATRPTVRPASACSTPRTQHLDAMPPYMGGGEMIESVHAGRHHLRQAAAQVRGRHAADRAGDRARRRAQLHDAGRPRAHRRATRPSSRTTRTSACAELNWLKIYGTRQGQGRHRLVQHRRAAPARHLDHHRPLGRGGARRPPLRPAADGPAGRDGHLPRLVRHVQHQGRGGCPGRGADQGARFLRVTVIAGRASAAMTQHRCNDRCWVSPHDATQRDEWSRHGRQDQRRRT